MVFPFCLKTCNRLSFLQDMVQSYSVSTYGRRAFWYAGPHAWNLLPEICVNQHVINNHLHTFSENIWIFSSRLRLRCVRVNSSLFCLMSCWSILSDSNSNSKVYIFELNITFALKLITTFKTQIISCDIFISAIYLDKL